MNEQKNDEDTVGTDLSTVREEINRIDRELLRLLSERRACSSKAVQVKELVHSPIRDRGREEQLLLDRIQIAKSFGLDAHYTTKVFHQILDDSIHAQQEHLQRLANADKAGDALVRVAFQGIEGSFSHMAALECFSSRTSQAVYLGCQTFKEVMTAVEQGRADYAIVPVEDTSSGGINEVYDLLLHTQLAIVAEKKSRVVYCLLALPAATLSGIKKVFCSPAAALQCSNFLSRLPNCHVEYSTDASLSGKRISEGSDKSVAAIASEEAARLFGLAVLERGITNQEENYTRFLIAARKPVKVDLRIPCKTSIVISTAQKPGALVEALLVFRENGINLTKLESRPVIGNPWEEMFYVDFEGNLEEDRVKLTLDELTRKARFIKVLGSYPCEEVPPTQISAKQRLNSGANAGAEIKPVAKAAAPAPKVSSKAKGYRLGSREYKAEDTIIDVRGIKIGGGGFVVLAGPCSVESYDQVMACAREVKENGGVILRGGCFKPRTSPYSFQGMGYEGLDILAQAGRKYGLPIITEVLSIEDMERVAEKSDMIQIGARNMQNFTLLSEAGRMHRPVLLKRGMSSSLEELLQATEYILAQGNQQVILCERGIRTFETATRSTLDLSAVPVLKARSHLPVIVDPSHAAGERDLVPPLALAAKAVGADGIIVEIHPEPEKALSDGPQALRFPEFADLMLRLLA
ncbi:MAG: bifunctional 3-deoxy-7-phosphoheptulonate synthase/chorismate mutase [Deltaproteobacteria bacterium]|nr:bifunctional 3-deoxy-7-phosphoheptulonate synthase/chorismate mutase [Deltaproteobacteria bacterium]